MFYKYRDICHFYKRHHIHERDGLSEIPKKTRWKSYTNISMFTHIVVPSPKCLILRDEMIVINHDCRIGV